jgi:hypothetical protein
MVIRSPYPDLDLPSVDIFTFLFKRKDQKFPDSHRKFFLPVLTDPTLDLTLAYMTFSDLLRWAYRQNPYL